MSVSHVKKKSVKKANDNDEFVLLKFKKIVREKERTLFLKYFLTFIKTLH